jgi:hypothetical protein
LKEGSRGGSGPTDLDGSTDRRGGPATTGLLGTERGGGLIGRDGARLVIEPIEIERDSMGWPLAWWELAGAAPGFDVGERGAPHERGDVLATKRRP